MKKTILNLMMIATLSFAVTSCKDKAKEVDTKDAQDAEMATAMSVKYMVDTTQSKIEWKGFKPTGTHNGTIAISEGVVNTDDGILTSGNIVIDMNSIQSLDLDGEGKMKLESHLKGTAEGKEGDFFNVKEHPNASFEITGMDTMENGTANLSGNLMLKGVKNNVTIPVKTSMNGDMMTIESDNFSIDRTKWGVNFGSKSIFDNLGDAFINDDIELKIMVKAKKA